MNSLLQKVALTVAVGSLLYSLPVTAQVSPTTKKTGRVRITRGPDMERVGPLLNRTEFG